MAAIKRLIKAQWPNLVRLNVEKTYIGEVVLAALLHGQWPQLQHINASRQNLASDMIKFTKRGWEQLVSLHLHNCGLSWQFLAAFHEANWPNLQDLRLSANYFYKRHKPNQHKRYFGSDIVSDWLSEAKMPNLTSLHFSCNHLINHKSQLGFATADWPLLQSLTLFHCFIGLDSALHTVVNGDWPQLTHLDLSNNDLGDGAIQTLSQAHWPLLRSLKLSKNHFKFAGVQGIVRLDVCLLERLDLSRNRLFSKAFKCLLKATWPRLSYLNVSDNTDSAACFRQLNILKWLQLQELII